VLKRTGAFARDCYERAHEARRRALETSDESIRDECLAFEARWLKLAESYEFSQRVGSFLNAFPKHPICPRCHVPMWLSKVRTEPEKMEYLYECKACEEKISVANTK
jgi:hypothetical protein